MTVCLEYYHKHPHLLSQEEKATLPDLIAYKLIESERMNKKS